MQLGHLCPSSSSPQMPSVVNPCRDCDQLCPLNRKWPTWHSVVAHIACHVIEYGRVGAETYCLATVSFGNGIEISRDLVTVQACVFNKNNHSSLRGVKSRGKVVVVRRNGRAQSASLMSEKKTVNGATDAKRW